MRESSNFCQGGSRPDSQKTGLTTFLFFFYFTVLHLQRVGKFDGYFKENYNFPRFQRGSNIFKGESNFFQGGSNFFQGGRIQMLISIETHITCDFSGGGVRTPTPLWIRTLSTWDLLIPFVHKSQTKAHADIYSGARSVNVGQSHSQNLCLMHESRGGAGGGGGPPP